MSAHVSITSNRARRTSHSTTDSLSAALCVAGVSVVKADGWAEFRLPEAVQGLWRVSAPLRKCSADFAMVLIRLAEMPVLASRTAELTAAVHSVVADAQLRPLYLPLPPSASARRGQHDHRQEGNGLS